MKKIHKCINGFQDDNGKWYHYGDRINCNELHALTSQQQRNFRIDLEVVEDSKMAA